MNTSNFIQLYGYETPTFENFIDLVFEDNKTFTRIYLRKENVETRELNEIIHVLTINYGFIIDKDLSDRVELIDFKTGTIRFYIWRNGLIEFYSKNLQSN